MHIKYLIWLYLRGVIGEADNLGGDHLMVEIVALACALTNTSKDGVTSVGLGHIVDQFHDQHSFAHSGTAKQTCQTETVQIGVSSMPSDLGNILKTRKTRHHIPKWNFWQEIYKNATESSQIQFWIVHFSPLKNDTTTLFPRMTLPLLNHQNSIYLWK